MGRATVHKEDYNAVHVICLHARMQVVLYSFSVGHFLTMRFSVRLPNLLLHLHFLLHFLLLRHPLLPCSEGHAHQ
jgi:hypothetical protein